MTTYSIITGTGSNLQENVLTNNDHEKNEETTQHSNKERTAINKRHRAEDGQTTCHLAEQAAREAMHAAGKTAADIDLII